jgi:hypothetical protein
LGAFFVSISFFPPLKLSGSSKPGHWQYLPSLRFQFNSFGFLELAGRFIPVLPKTEFYFSLITPFSLRKINLPLHFPFRDFRYSELPPENTSPIAQKDNFTKNVVRSEKGTNRNFLFSQPLFVRQKS